MKKNEQKDYDWGPLPVLERVGDIGIIAPWPLDDTIPGPSSRAEFKVFVDDPVDSEFYTVELALNHKEYSWFINEKDPTDRNYTKTLSLYGFEQKKIAIACSRANTPITISSTIFFSDGGNSQIVPTTVGFDVPFGDDADVKIVNNNASANGVDRITAVVTVKRDGMAIPDVEVHMNLMPDDTAAILVPSKTIQIDPKDRLAATGTSNKDGQVLLDITNVMAQAGSIYAHYKGRKPSIFDVANGIGNFVFTHPEMTIDVYGVGQVTSGPGDFVEWSGDAIASAAFGKETMLRVGARILVNTASSGKVPWSIGKIRLKETNGVAIFSTGAAGTTLVSEIELPLKDGFTELVGVNRPEVCSGSISATLVGDGRDETGKQNLRYELTDPCVGIRNVYSSFSTLAAKRSIYKNTRHIVELQVTIDPMDYNGDPYSTDYMSRDTFALAKLIDYNDPKCAGMGAGWYSTDIVDKNSPFTGIKDDPGAVIDITREVAGASAHVVTNTYYITADKQATQYEFGLKITPPGKLVLSSTKPGVITKYKIGQVSGPQPTVNFCEAGVKVPAIQRMKIGTMDEVKLDISLLHRELSNIDPPDLSFETIRKFPDNFFKSWYCKLSMKPNPDNSYIAQTRIDVDQRKPGSYEVNCVGSGFLRASCYLWPNNICDSKGNKLEAKASYDMGGDDFPAQKFTIKDNEEAIVLGIFWRFSDFLFGNIQQNPVSLRIYDQFGSELFISIKLDTGNQYTASIGVIWPVAEELQPLNVDLRNFMVPSVAPIGDYRPSAGSPADPAYTFVPKINADGDSLLCLRLDTNESSHCCPFSITPSEADYLVRDANNHVKSVIGGSAERWYVIPLWVLGQEINYVIATSLEKDALVWTVVSSPKGLSTTLDTYKDGGKNKFTSLNPFYL